MAYLTFTPTPLEGLYLVQTEQFRDDRGAMEISWCADDLVALGLDARVAQCNVASNRRRGTIRGMHYQAAPAAETKLIRPLRGSVFDVAVDLRPASPTYLRWHGVELVAGACRMLYVPAGFAHGYQTLDDDADVSYLVSTPYSPPHQRGIRWNDPAVGIEWPLGAPTVINQRDATYPDLLVTR